MHLFTVKTSFLLLTVAPFSCFCKCTIALLHRQMSNGVNGGLYQVLWVSRASLRKTSETLRSRAWRVKQVLKYMQTGNGWCKSETDLCQCLIRVYPLFPSLYSVITTQAIFLLHSFLLVNGCISVKLGYITLIHPDENFQKL